MQALAWAVLHQPSDRQDKSRWGKKNTTKITINFFTQDDPYTILTIFLLGRPRLCSGLKVDFWWYNSAHKSGGYNPLGYRPERRQGLS